MYNTHSVKHFFDAMYKALRIPENIQRVSHAILPIVFEFEPPTKGNRHPYLMWFQFLFDSLRPTADFEKEYCIANSLDSFDNAQEIKMLKCTIQSIIDQKVADGTLSDVDSHHLSQMMYSSFFVLKNQMNRDSAFLRGLDLNI